jgi:hypothetical protein
MPFGTRRPAILSQPRRRNFYIALVAPKNATEAIVTQ